MIAYIKRRIMGWENSIIVSPDAGGAKRCVDIVIASSLSLFSTVDVLIIMLQV